VQSIGTIRAPWVKQKEEDAKSIPYAVDWVIDTSKESDENMQSQFNLGDFANFGEFVRAMIGEQSQINEAN
jgi:hypothetical protein